MSARLRIVSLAPSQTEILAALGLTDELLGISEDCDYPEAVRSLPTYGGWWDPDVPRIIAEAPGLVCTFGKRQEEIAGFLRGAGLQVFHSDPGTIAAALDTITELATLTGTRDVAAALRSSLAERIQRVRQQVAAARSARPPRVFRIMHWQPLISVGPGAFQHDVIVTAGGHNVMADGTAPYFVCDPLEVRRRDPEIIFFCEPQIRDHLQNDSAWRGVSAVRHDHIHVFDCGLTCRSGPRIVDMLEMLAGVVEMVSSEQ